jgi:hypothetical protein
MNEPIKVVMLPTEDKTHIVLRNSDNKLIYYKNLVCNKEFVHLKGQHLYVTDSQPIKKWDWFIDGGVIFKAIMIDGHLNIPNEPAKDFGRVIATTDPRLTIKAEQAGDNVWVNPMPQIQQSFIEEFVANPDGEYEVKYSWLQSCVDAPSGHIYELKLNQDNTVSITFVEDEMYSKEEVEEKMRKSYIYGQADKSMDYTIREDWIEENL